VITETSPVILLAGPTASGKTALAVRLAKALNGEIINADSMQIYADLEILSARPGKAEQGGIAHHLFGTVDAAERASTGWWAAAAMEQIDAIRGRGRRPIIVGGTGLYFNALVKGLAAMPEISDRTRQSADDIEAQGAEALREQAMAFDPEATGRIKPADLQRLRRVVEIGLETGQPISAFQARTTPLLPECGWTGLVIELERQWLYQRIEARFDTMMDQGALDEVRTLAERGLDRTLPAMKALGVPPLMAFLAGTMDRETAIVQAKQDTRRYAKRQMTWFRNQMPGWTRLAGSPAPISDEDVISLLHTTGITNRPAEREAEE